MIGRNDAGQKGSRTAEWREQLSVEQRTNNSALSLSLHSALQPSSALMLCNHNVLNLICCLCAQAQRTAQARA